MSKKILLATALVAGFAGSAVADEAVAKKPVAKAGKIAEKPCPAPVKKHHKVAPPKPVHHHHKPVHHEPKGLTVTLGGELDTQVGYRKQKYTFDTDQPNVLPQPLTVNKTHKFALVNDTKIHVKAEGHAHGMKYGGRIVLNADTSDNKYSSSPFSGNDNTANNKVGFDTKVWVRTQFGKLEAGSTTGAYEALKVSAANIARATGGIDGDAQYWWNPFIINDGNITDGIAALTAENFIVNPNLPTNYVHGLDANSAKISYYTPAFMGFKAGISFAKDSEQRGTVSKTQTVFRNRALNPSLTGYEDVWEGGLRYKGQFDKIGIKASVLGNTAQAKNYATSTTNVVLTRQDLRAWEAGAAIDFMGVTVAGSYGSWGKSGVAKTSDGITPTFGKKKGSFWNVGGSYEHHAFATSLTYMESHKGTSLTRSSAAATIGAVDNITSLQSANKFRLLSFGVDYKLAPGFMPYMEANWFSMKTGKAGALGNDDRQKNTGFIILAGTKLHF